MKTQLILKTLASIVCLATITLPAAQPPGGATNAAPPSPAASSTRPIPSRSISTSATRGTPAAATTNAVATPTAPPAPSAPPSFPPPPAPGVTARPVTPATAVPAIPAQPQAAKAKPDKGEEIVPLLNFDNMPLGQVLEFYSELVGRTILRANSLPITTFITLKSRGPLTKTEAITALETVMAMNGIGVVPVGEKFIKVVVEGALPQSGGEFNKADPKDLPDSGKFVTQIVDLKNIAVDDAVAAITPFAKSGGAIIPIKGSQTIVLRDYSENVKRMMEMIEKVDKVNPLLVKPEVIPIKYAQASDIAQVLGQLTPSGAGTSVGRSSANRGLSGATSSTSPGGMNPGTMGQNPNPSTGLNSGTMGSRSSFQNRLESIVRRAQSAGEFQILGEVKIISDERTNSLLIFANDEDMVMIKTIIKELDVVLAQVLIEGIIMEVSLSDTFTAGLSYQQQPKKLGGGVTGAGGVIEPNGGAPNFLNTGVASLLSGTNASAALLPTALPGGFSYFTKIGSFDAALQLAAGDSRVNVLSRPRIQTSHGQEARLFIGDTIPYVTGTYFGGVSSQSSSQYQQKEVGISLDVKPLINPDGLVVMDIQQNIEQLGTPIRIDQNDVPTTTKREASSQVSVKDRETIVLGGFISTTKTKSKSGVPWLKDIPWVGNLFRNKTDNTKRVELMVFLRPTVLPTPESAAITAADERDKLPGLKQGEYEIREDERKRNEALEAEMRKKLGLKEPKRK